MEAAADLEPDGVNSLRNGSVSSPTNDQLPTPLISPYISPTLRTLDAGLNGHARSSIGRLPHLNGGPTPTKDDYFLHVDEIERPALPSARRPSRETIARRRTSSNRMASTLGGEVHKLAPSKILELTSSPEFLPVRVATSSDDGGDEAERSPSIAERFGQIDETRELGGHKISGVLGERRNSGTDDHSDHLMETQNGDVVQPQTAAGVWSKEERPTRPVEPNRTLSTPPNFRRKSALKTHSALQHASNQGKPDRKLPPPLDLRELKAPQAHASSKPPVARLDAPSPIPANLPLPPMSMPLYLQLELATGRPSPLYIHRSARAELPYEPDAVKFERLLNFLRLPKELECVLGYGAFACLDSFLYIFTILPLRFIKAASILSEWALQNLMREARDIGGFIYLGVPRVWVRRKERQRTSSQPKKEPEKLSEQITARLQERELVTPSQRGSGMNWQLSDQGRKQTKTSKGHKRSRSTPSELGTGHKADLLKGLLVVASSAILLRFDASRMYHSIRGQAAIKLYVIYNVLEVADRLLSAMGQDILECLFSSSVLARDANGRSLIWRPFWMFCLALVYNVVHATALFYQVVTLNVAVNSYSNALLTLLMSNQFVEIKGTVFKKFEKENLFQLTCADIVERFQLWLMLTIIALRNVVEVGNLNISLSSFLGSGSNPSSPDGNVTAPQGLAVSILPRALTVLPSWAGEVLGPFLIVLGSEMFVDWLKHAYISKFNNTKPEIYGRFLDVIAKDYYHHAFAEQNLTKRFGMPVLPLACLFIRAASQTYHMFLATYMPLPIPSTATSVSVESATSSPDTTAALARIDRVFRRALGRSTFGSGGAAIGRRRWWSVDDVIALTTMLAFFLICYFVLLAAKLLLGMALLSFARRRYAAMKERERGAVDTEGRRAGGWGVVEVDEEKRRWIYTDDEQGLDKLRARDERAKREAREGKMVDLTNVDRYQMVAKRIW